MSTVLADTIRLQLPPSVLPLPGMRLRDGCRVFRIEHDENGPLAISLSTGGQTLNWGCHCTRLPTWPSGDAWQLDLEDPVTQWGLVTIAQRLWSSPFLHPATVENIADRTLWGWAVYVNPFDHTAPEFRSTSLPHALLTAIWSKVTLAAQPEVKPSESAPPTAPPPGADKRPIWRSHSLANDLFKSDIHDAVVTFLKSQKPPFDYTAKSVRCQLPPHLRTSKKANVPLYVGQVLALLANDWQNHIIRTEAVLGASAYTLARALPVHRDCTAVLVELLGDYLQQQPLPYSFQPQMMRHQLHLQDVQTWLIAAAIARLMAQHPESFIVTPVANETEVTIQLVRPFWH